MSYRVFISYSSIDDTVADEVILILQNAGVDYFLDRKDIEWGADIPRRIADGLAQCGSLLVIVSPASLKSQWVPYEVGQAIALEKAILPFLTHPSLDLPGYLQNYSHKVRLTDVKELFESLLHLKDRTLSLPAPAHSSLFVDLMRLLGVASIDSVRSANFARYEEFIGMADRHLSDFRSAFARVASRLDDEAEIQSSLLEKRLSWMLGRLEGGPPVDSRNGGYFEVMQKVATDLHITLSSALGECYAKQVRRVEADLTEALQNGMQKNTVESLDGLWRLRHNIQSRILATADQFGQRRIRSIIEDMDNQFGTLYFALDRALLPRILQLIDA
jgi:hypothetical protein